MKRAAALPLAISAEGECWALAQVLQAWRQVSRRIRRKRWLKKRALISIRDPAEAELKRIIRKHGSGAWSWIRHG